MSSTGGTIHEWASLIEAMQRKAAKKGANAIILKTTDKTVLGSAGGGGGSFYAGTGVQKSMMARAIRILNKK